MIPQPTVVSKAHNNGTLAYDFPAGLRLINYRPRYVWYVIVLLTLASTLSFIDRQILNVMIGPIKRDLGGLSDTEISLIIGLAFSLIYSLTTWPAARLADRGNRRNLIAAGIFAWSLMTALAGMANNFWQLFLARMGVGVGEATLGPASTSVLRGGHRAVHRYGSRQHCWGTVDRLSRSASKLRSAAVR
jgi:sugar phosphate permease